MSSLAEKTILLPVPAMAMGAGKLFVSLIQAAVTLGRRAGSVSSPPLILTIAGPLSRKEIP